MSRRPGSAHRRFAAVVGTLFALATTGAASAQVSDDELSVLRLESTPLGALPPLALPMPAHRDHNYWGVRVQAGHRQRGGADLFALGAGVDFQWRGGSIFGLTGGYQERDCALTGPDCGRHLLVGARARFNFVTAGPTIGRLLGDYSATTTLGTEVGLGYAPDVLPGMDACAIDFGVPLSLAMFQRVRLTSFLTPGAALEIDCAASSAPARWNFLTGLGVGLQQLPIEGLDVYVGFQKIFRNDSGYQLGISVTYVWLPTIAEPGEP